MRIAGIVLLTIAAVLIVPSLVYAGYMMNGDRDPYWLYVRAGALVAGVGACLAVIGGWMIAVATRR